MPLYVVIHIIFTDFSGYVFLSVLIKLLPLDTSILSTLHMKKMDMWNSVLKLV